ncbi:MAG: histidine phosphatase family protein [Paracoccus sp. (in: a-proteobacteria)]|uniref:histidine phosphatase family protein n=1 Tax=Paracoccus sp. TaxID=267 RepID=UPI0026E04AF5|nr:histidine phosphatase family protein [Paracoccus sp. (in: a-proteobacteria)]MDO5614382.1 histidine phosphatase family protein [Paracoccus sp. (in: a-proteobacteria)]
MVAAMTRLLLIRHAPAITGGRLAGRRDVPADCSDTAAAARLAAVLPDPAAVWISPALRCQQTAALLGLSGETRPALWEQDFGAWEGAAYADLPDPGDLEATALAALRPPGGESFADMAARVLPVLQQARDEVVIVAHAGTVRAALSLVIGDAALSFAVAPLSLTEITRAGRHWAVSYVNRQP